MAGKRSGNPKPSNPFVKGQCGNPAGRPKSNFQEQWRGFFKDKAAFHKIMFDILASKEVIDLNYDPLADETKTLYERLARHKIYQSFKDDSKGLEFLLNLGIFNIQFKTDDTQSVNDSQEGKRMTADEIDDALSKIESLRKKMINDSPK